MSHRGRHASKGSNSDIGQGIITPFKDLRRWRRSTDEDTEEPNGGLTADSPTGIGPHPDPREFLGKKPMLKDLSLVQYSEAANSLMLNQPSTFLHFQNEPHPEVANDAFDLDADPDHLEPHQACIGISAPFPGTGLGPLARGQDYQESILGVPSFAGGVQGLWTQTAFQYPDPQAGFHLPYSTSWIAPTQRHDGTGTVSRGWPTPKVHQQHQPNSSPASLELHLDGLVSNHQLTVTLLGGTETPILVAKAPDCENSFVFNGFAGMLRLARHPIPKRKVGHCRTRFGIPVKAIEYARLDVVTVDSNPCSVSLNIQVMPPQYYTAGSYHVVLGKPALAKLGLLDATSPMMLLDSFTIGPGQVGAASRLRLPESGYTHSVQGSAMTLPEQASQLIGVFPGAISTPPATHLAAVTLGSHPDASATSEVSGDTAGFAETGWPGAEDIGGQFRGTSRVDGSTLDGFTPGVSAAATRHTFHSIAPGPYGDRLFREEGNAESAATTTFSTDGHHRTGLLPDGQNPQEKSP